MFKRANKITALLVAAASVMSVVPAMADTTSSSRLGSKDGTIENAIAFQDGKYVYQGYKSDDDSDSVYYNDGSKDKELDDVSDADLNRSYEDKYAYAKDGDDEYLVDLTNGDVTDDTTPSDDTDTAQTKLETKLKKADRYDTNVSNVAVQAIPSAKFGDNWYAYSATPAAGSDGEDYEDASGKLYGFTDGNGKYIDASYTANIYAYSTFEGKTVKIENYSDAGSDSDSDSLLKARLIQQPVALTQDKDYIYALATVAITDTADNFVATGGTTTSAIANLPSDLDASKTVVRTFIQKIAKAQGDQKDGAYLPKTVESYEIGNSTGNEYDCGDAKDAYNGVLAAIHDGSGASLKDLTEVTQDDVINTADTGIEKPIFTISDGNLVAVDAVEGDSVDGITLKFKKDKVKFKTFPGYKTSTSTTAEGVSTDKDSKFDAYLVEKDSDDSVDIDDSAKTYSAYDIDVDGNVWVVADGKIYKYVAGGDMTKVYTCDSSLDAISVYDENNIVTWENGGDIYTTVGEGKAETSTEAGTTTGAATVQTGWVQLADGTWNLYDATGNKVVNNWAIVGGTWYYLKADGVMATGWTNVGGTWYYLNASGAMQTGWFNDNGTWYYLQSSGAMATGWFNDNGTWYYLNASGAMLANTTVDGYVLGASGAW
ncbi:N-acetylmuramoyl-L-alanine amidase family protein, partial [Clostridium sp. BL-8]|uniref:N-acetylmuramoyl-L-alanine amidase family protein n=1 Tax=Clostridium sp. BL-8 TaxID=349938 RepID=UPI00098C3CA6